MVTLLDPKNDYVFKRLFAGDADLTVALINDLRPDLPLVASVEILNPTIEASELSGKGIVLDVLARQLDAGEAYQAVGSAVGIHLLDFDLFTANPAQRAQAVWRFEMRDQRQSDVVLGNELQLNIVELKKADRLGAMPAPGGDWISFFEHWQEDAVMANVTHDPVKKAMGSIRQLSADEEAQRLAEARARGLWNWNHSISAARREGLEQGLEQGREKGRLQALRDTLSRQLARRFGELPSGAIERLEAASAEELDAWADEILVAGSLDELFGRT